MRTRRLILLLVLFIIILGLTGCVSDSKYAELEKRLENVEDALADMQKTGKDVDNSQEDNNASNNNSDKSEEDNIYAKATDFGLYFDFNPQTVQMEGDFYQLYLSEDYTTRKKQASLCYRINGEYGEGVFTEDVFYKLLEKILGHTLEKYENPVDENGRIHYDIVPCVLYLHGSKYYGEEFEQTFFNMNDEMDDIISEFKKLVELSQN